MPQRSTFSLISERDPPVRGFPTSNTVFRAEAKVASKRGFTSTEFNANEGDVRAPIRKTSADRSRGSTRGSGGGASPPGFTSTEFNATPSDYRGPIRKTLADTAGGNHPLVSGSGASQPGPHPFHGGHVAAVKSGVGGASATGKPGRFFTSPQMGKDGNAESLSQALPGHVLDSNEGDIPPEVEAEMKRLDPDGEAATDSELEDLEDRARTNVVNRTTGAAKGRGRGSAATGKPNNWAKWDAEHPKR